jgi:hypothetical protein
MIRYQYGRSIWEIDTGDGTSMRYRYQYGYGIWDIDSVILDIDMGYLVTLLPGPTSSMPHSGYRSNTGDRIPIAQYVVVQVEIETKH